MSVHLAQVGITLIRSFVHQLKCCAGDRSLALCTLKMVAALGNALHIITVHIVHCKTLAENVCVPIIIIVCAGGLACVWVHAYVCAN